MSHVVLDGHTTIGRGNRFFPFCSVGIEPQDLKYKGEPTRCELGDFNTIRECVTISRGTVGGGLGVTKHRFELPHHGLRRTSVMTRRWAMAASSPMRTTLAGHVIGGGLRDDAGVRAGAPVLHHR